MGPGCECKPGYNLQPPVPPAIYRKHSALSSGSLPPARGPRSRGQEAVLLAHPPARVEGALNEQDSFAYREEAGSGVSATGTGSRRCSEQEPELPAASRAISLPICFSSGYGRRMHTGGESYYCPVLMGETAPQLGRGREHGVDRGQTEPQWGRPVGRPDHAGRLC